MNTKSLLCMTGIFLVCLLAVGSVSAYKVDSASASMKEIFAQSGNLSAFELIYEHTDGSIGTIKIWTGHIVSPEDSFREDLERTLADNNGAGKNLSRVVFTTIAGNTRVSYVLSNESKFVRQSIPIAFPGGESPNVNASSSTTMMKPLYTYTISRLFDKTLNGRTLSYYYASSATSPSTTLPVMTAETWIKILSGGQWVDDFYVGYTRFNQPSVLAQDSGRYTLTPGTYKQFGHWEGDQVDYVPYSFDDSKPQFVVT